MANFIVNPESISQSEALEELDNFLDSRPDATKWKDFFESGVGQTIKGMLAGMSAFFSYNTIVARRESYFRYATNRSSAIAGSQFLGYSSFRGKNPHLNITITPNFSGTINKFDIIGNVNDRDLVANETVVVNENHQTSLEVIIGDKLTEELSADSDSSSIFRFTSPRVSEDLRILIDGSEVEVSQNMKELTKEKFITQTNVFESVDGFYRNSINSSIRYNTGSIITLEYIEYKEFDYELSDVEFDLGVLNNIEVINIFENPETLNSIQINAPLYNETQFTVRGRNDQEKMFRLFDTSIVDTKGNDISPAVIELFYIRDDKSLFTESEKSVLIQRFENIRQFGMLPPTISDPIVNYLKISVNAVLIKNVVGDATNLIKDVMDQYENILEAEISFEDVESEIEDLKNESKQELIKIARVKIDSNDWQASDKYSLGTYINSDPDNGRVYKMNRIVYFSGSSEPSWPTNEGDTVIDNGILWEAISQSDVSSVTGWVQDQNYQIGNEVKPTSINGFKYKAIEYVNKSGNSEPSWPALGGGDPSSLKGELVYDGDILWMALPQEGTPSSWSPNTKYNTGEVVVASNQSSSDTVGIMFQVLMFVGTSNSSQPSFPTVLDSTIIDNNIEWITKDPSLSPEKLRYDQYYSIETTVTLT